MKVDKIGEFGLIEKLVGSLKNNSDKVLKGIGDDAAVLKVNSDRVLLVTCDIQLEGTHFLSNKISPKQLGQRIAAVNLSDIAAMGGIPLFAVASLVVTPHTSVTFLDDLYDGLITTLNNAGAELVGGNTAKTKELLAIDLFLIGETQPNRVLTRDTAVEGDVICVTGDLGASAAGLALLKNTKIDCSQGAKEQALARHFTPTARIKEGRVLGASGVVNACIDISDGLLQDAGHIANQSFVDIKIDAEKIPVSFCAREIAQAVGANPLDWAVSGGEDFELMFTVAKSECDSLLKKLKKETGTSATAIGQVKKVGQVKTTDNVKKETPQVQLRKNEQLLSLSSLGYDHFK